MKQRHRRAGKQIHTSRAKMRNSRHKKPSDAQTLDAKATLTAWLNEHLPTLHMQTQNARDLCLDTYLRRTLHTQVELAERLRLLAIHLEDLNDIQTVMRIYTRAVAYAPKNIWVLRSYAIVMQWQAEQHHDPKQKQTTHTKAWTILNNAYALSDTDAMRGELLYLLGYGHYCAPDTTTEQALEYFHEALHHVPDHPWSLLYKAHCLHDLKRWAKAAQAYNAVPHAPFNGPPSWRMHLLVEQRGHCYSKAGNRQEALGDFRTIAERYMRQPHLAEYAFAWYLRDAIASDKALQHALLPLVQALLERLELPPLVV